MQSSMLARTSTLSRSGGCGGWAGAVPATSDPHTGEGRGGRAGAVLVAQRSYVGGRPQWKGIARRRGERASRVGHEHCRHGWKQAARTGKHGVRTNGHPESITVNTNF